MLKLKGKIGLHALWIAVLVWILDYTSKSWMLTHLHPHEHWVITSFFNFFLTFNTGASFGFLHDASGWQWYFFTALSSVASVGFLIWLYFLKPHETLNAVGLNFILGGAVGNLTDRLMYGVVTDFLQFHWESWSFAVFNVADAFISVGTFLVIMDWWRTGNSHTRACP